MSAPVRRKFQQDSVIWLDADIDKSTSFANVRQDFHTIFNSVKTYSDPDRCIDYLLNKNSNDEFIFFIVSATLGKNVVQLVHEIPQVYRIYVYSSNTSSRVSWADQYDKVERTTFNDVQLLYEHLKKDKKKYENEFVAISFISESEIQAGNRQDPSFIYNQLLKDILNDTKHDPEDNARQQMVQFCREYYKNKTNQLTIINEFDREFFPEHVFYWYTRDCFLYQILNKALWTPEPAVLYKLRYFIRHLQTQLMITAEQQSNLQKVTKVFRGQGIPTSEFNKLKNGIGGLLSFNNFLSTSLDRNVALDFAEASKYLSDETSVLFTMNIDSKNRKCPFIVVGDLSYFQNVEKEVLFSMGTVFHIDSVKKASENQWEVELTLTDNTDDSLAHYTAKVRRNIRSSHPLISLVKLMDEMGQYRMIDAFADIFAEDELVRQHPGHRGAIQHALGTAYLSAGNSDRALKFLEDSLTTYSELLPNDHPSLSPTFNNIGSVYLTKKDYEKALQYQQKALDCQLNASDPDLKSIVTYSMNIGTIYQNLEQYDEALVHLHRALELQKQSLGPDDPALSLTCDVIARIYQGKQEFGRAASYKKQAREINEKAANPDPNSLAQSSILAGQMSLAQGNYKEAIDHFQNALKTQQKYLLPNHPSIASTYNYLARTYYKQDKFSESIPFYQKALEIEQSSLIDNHPSIALSHYNMSTAYSGMSQYEQALECAKKSVEQLRKQRDSDPTSLGRYIRQVGLILQKQGKYTEAIRHYEESLTLVNDNMDDDEEGSGAVAYYNIGDAYFKLNKFTDALSSYQKALDIELRSLPKDAPTIAKTYSSISNTQLKLSKYNEALKNAHNAVNQLRKRSNPNPIELSTYLCHVGDILNKQDKPSEAIDYYSECLAITITVVGDQDKSLAAIYFRLAECYSELNNFTDALTFYKKTLEIEQNSFEDDHPTLAVTYYKISNAYQNMSKYNEASQYARHAVNQLRKRPNPNLAELGQYLYRLGNTLHKLGNHSEAVNYFEEGLAAILSIKDKNDASLAPVFFNIGGAYLKLNKFSEALSYYEKALAIELRTLPDDAETIASTYTSIAAIYTGLQQYDKAMDFSQKALDQLLKTLPSNHDDVKQQRSNLEIIRKKQLLANIYKK